MLQLYIYLYFLNQPDLRLNAIALGHKNIIEYIIVSELFRKLGLFNFNRKFRFWRIGRVFIGPK